MPTVVAVLSLALTPKAYAFEVPSAGNGYIPQKIYGYADFPDPSSAGSGVNLQAFATGTPYPLTGNWQPGQTLMNGLSNVTVYNGNNCPGWNTAAAPTVAYILGQYVMWFSGYQSSGSANLLYAATSSSLTGPFTVRQCYHNSGPSSYGLFDPNLVQDAAGNWWLLWSIETAHNVNPNYIDSTALSADGTVMQGFASSLDSYLSMIGYSGSEGSQQGTNPQMENPNLVVDPQGTFAFDLMYSWGTWNEAGNYHTGEASCNSLQGPCGDYPQYVQFDKIVEGGGNPAVITNVGGLSTPQSSPYWDDQFFMFAASSSGTASPRSPYFESTNSGTLYGNQSLMEGSPNSNNIWCMCIPNYWALEMQTDGNLVIYNNQHVAQWNTHTSGSGSGTYMIMQNDGNLVVYNSLHQALWVSSTPNNPGAHLVFQNTDGNLVIYSSSGAALWSSHT